MADFLNCTIGASGPSHTIERIKSLINEHTHANEGGEFTCFAELTDINAIGYRWRSIEGEYGNEVLWVGQLPCFPRRIGEELSMRFPDVTFNVNFSIANDDYESEEGTQAYEYNRGKGRLTYHW